MFKMSQSPQIGSMFLTRKVCILMFKNEKPESQSPQIGSMFLTAIGIGKNLIR